MSPFDRTQLRRIVDSSGEWLVSIYLPTHPVGPAGQEDAIRLKNLLKTAESKLVDLGMRGANARDMLELCAKLPVDPIAWEQRSQGMALFVAPGFFAEFQLPFSVAETVTVGRRFLIKPLIPAVGAESRFHVLVLSQNEVSLYLVTEGMCEHLNVKGLPGPMKEALGYDQTDRGEQVHSAMAGSRGKQAAVFHGQGGAPDTEKKDLGAFCRLVDTAVCKYLHGDQGPLLLACVDSVACIYRDVNSYPALLPTTLRGNHDYESTTNLHEKALHLANAYFQEQITAEANYFRQHAETERTSDEVCQIVSAAREGRIRTLFADSRATMYGKVCTDDGHVQVTNDPNDEDLVDLAVVETLRTGGAVYSYEYAALPTNSPVAAVLRY